MMSKLLWSLLALVCSWEISLGQGVSPSSSRVVLNNINIQAPPYNAKADTVFLTDGVVSASSTAFSSASATFTSADVGKLIQVNYGGLAGALLSTTIAAFVDAHHVTLASPATIATPTKLLANTPGIATAQSGAGSYAPGDSITVSGGTGVITAAAFTIATTKLVSATANAVGSGGTNGACTLTGTTGTGTLFQIAATISGNSISALGSITTAGSYSVNPTVLTAEPVTSNCSLVGATLNLNMGGLTLSGTNAGIYGALPSNPAATTSGGSGTGLTLTLTAGVAGGAFSYGTDNAASINAAITAAQTRGIPLYIPASLACYGYIPPLQITSGLSSVGDWVSGLNGNINTPSGSPALLGSVICPIANSSDAIDITGNALTVNFTNIGINWQTTLGQSSSATGDGIHYVPTLTQGLNWSTWNNVMVFGHDGSHYAYNLQNAIYNTYLSNYAWGGGGYNITSNGVTGFYGNSTFLAPQIQTIVGGSANAYTIAGTSGDLDQLTFESPQAGMANQFGVTPVGNPVTNAQLAWSQNVQASAVRVIAPDWFGNVIGQAALIDASSPGKNNYDIQFLPAGMTIKSPAWLQNGITWPGGVGHTYTDTTSTGTVAAVTGAAIPNFTLAATNPLTVTRLATLTVPIPVKGANITSPELASIVATGEILTTQNITAQAGMFISGTGNSTLNKNSSTGSTEIGDGTTSGTVTIGGANNLTNLYSKNTQFGNGAGVPAHLSSGQTTAPALTSCGTGSPTISGTDTAGTVTTGTTATGCVITFNVAYTTAPHCAVTWRGSPLVTQSYAVSNTAITLTQTATTGDLIDYICVAPSGG